MNKASLSWRKTWNNQLRPHVIPADALITSYPRLLAGLLSRALTVGLSIFCPFLSSHLYPLLLSLLSLFLTKAPLLREQGHQGRIPDQILGWSNWTDLGPVTRWNWRPPEPPPSVPLLAPQQFRQSSGPVLAFQGLTLRFWVVFSSTQV